MTGGGGTMTTTGSDPLAQLSFLLWQQEPAGDNSAQHQQLMALLMRALDETLTPRQRQVLLLYYGGASVTRIAQELGVGKPTISRTLRRARRRLEQALQYTI